MNTRLIKIINKTIRITFMAALSSSFAMAEEDATAQAKPQPGKAEAEARCLICHGSTQMGQQRLAPPMVMVKRHYQSLSQQEFEKVVMAWVKKPEAKKSKMPGAIRRFNLMPTFVIPESEVKLIANYIYKTDFAFPANCGHSSAKAATQAKGGKAGAGCDDANCGSGQGKNKGKGKGCEGSDCGPGKNKGKNKGKASDKATDCPGTC